MKENNRAGWLVGTCNYIIQYNLIDQFLREKQYMKKKNVI